MTETAYSVTVSQPPNIFELVIAGGVESIFLGRRLVTHAADSWLINDTSAYILQLVITEFLTNSVRVCPGAEIRARLDRVVPGYTNAVLVSVWDPSPIPPQVVMAEELDLTGRGLHIVVEYCNGLLGWEPTANPVGKWVRAILELKP